MLSMFALGILWLVVFYLANGDMPVLASLGNGHLLVGFGFIVLGLRAQHAVALTWR